MGCLLKGGGGLYERLSVGALVLAAGEGSRLGFRPKSLIEVAGVPLIRRQLIGLSSAGVDQVVVVVGHYTADIMPVIEDFPITIVDVSDEKSSSQKISVNKGLSALNGKFDAVIVVPGDMPLLGGQDFIDLIGAYKKRAKGILMVRPRVADKIGNPVMFDYSIVDEENNSQHPFCRNWWIDHPSQCLEWETDNSRYCIDLDTIEDVKAVEKRLGRPLVIPQSYEEANGAA